MAGSALHDTTKKGEFQRKPSTFRNWVKEGAEFAPEPHRYHLYISWACPWACSAAAAMFLKGLEGVIGLSVTHPTWQKTKPAVDNHAGWTFAKPGTAFSSPAGHGSFAFPDTDEDPINAKQNIREIYEEADPNFQGRYTVPILWDRRKGTIVNNESMDLIRIFNREFNTLAERPDVDLRPTDLEETIDSVHPWLYNGINNGVYRCGFAKAQEAYDEAINELTNCLDRAESILSKQRFLVSNDMITEVDIRLFQTLIRFDDVYVTYFKTNTRVIREMHNLFNYVKDLYQQGLSKVVNLPHIRTHYFSSHPELNPFAVVPPGPGVDYNAPHDRDRFSK